MLTIGYSTKSIDKKYINHLKKSCGIKNVEIIPFENKGTHSLTEVYDHILKESSNNIVVLCHDDIRFKTKKWGVRLIEHFNKSEYGIIGVAGTYDYDESGMWWKKQDSMVGIVNHKNPNDGKEFESKYSASVDDFIIPVVALDGLFFSVNKKKIKYSFDKTIKGFHFYDVDFTLGNYLNGVKVGCITNIRLLHLSVGQTNDQWEENRLIFKEKWKNELPVKTEEVVIPYSDKKIKLLKSPKISIVILSKSNNELLFNCIDSFLEKSEYCNYEIIVGDTGSNKEEIYDFKNRYNQQNIEIHEIGEYNFAKNNNLIVKDFVSEESELVLFCNNDIQIINDVLSNMVHFYNNNKNCGTMGARLYYEDKTIQHSGIMVLNLNQQIALTHHGIKTRYKYHNGNKEVFGNTAALLMINKTLFTKIGGFNEEYNECFEDVDLNNKLVLLNKKNYIISNSVAFHYESQTRNKSEKKQINENIDIQKVIPKIISNKNSHKYIMNINR